MSFVWSFALANCCSGTTNMLRLLRRWQHVQAQVTAPMSGLVPIFSRLPENADKVALKDCDNQNYTYANLYLGAKHLAYDMVKHMGGVKRPEDHRVIFLCPNDANYVVTLWALWLAGLTAVPVSPLHPNSLLTYYTKNCKASLIVTTKQFADQMSDVANKCNAKLYLIEDNFKSSLQQRTVVKAEDWRNSLVSDKFYDKHNALILYTSGSTGSPKGVVLTHRNIQFQVETLVNAWHWRSHDTILHTLPLHHVHGIVNALLCPMSVAAKTIMLSRFDANETWSHMLGVGKQYKQDDSQPASTNTERKVNVFMAVPTIYSKLIECFDNIFASDPKMVEYIKLTLKNRVRLMVSGSAPLSVRTFERWKDITGHSLLERYGMTEIGMCLSESYGSPESREAGFVGLPLTGVSVKIRDPENHRLVLKCVNEDGNPITSFFIKDCWQGELLVKSDGVFSHYIHNAGDTDQDFTDDRWFITGDIVEYWTSKKKFKILGRKSVDIIKSGGFKISALQVETSILSFDKVADCTVIGLDDEQYGQKVVALVVFKKNEIDNIMGDTATSVNSSVVEDGAAVSSSQMVKTVSQHSNENLSSAVDAAVDPQQTPISRNASQILIKQLEYHVSETVAKYAVPKLWRIVDEIPKNAMGKVNKKEIIKNEFSVQSKS